jgi:hypothetical protein
VPDTVAVAVAVAAERLLPAAMALPPDCCEPIAWAPAAATAAVAAATTSLVGRKEDLLRTWDGAARVAACTQARLGK